MNTFSPARGILQPRFFTPLLSVLFLSVALPLLAAEDVYTATGESGILGTVTSGDLNSTHVADGTAQKIAEVKDDSGQYRLQWSWQFTGIDTSATGYQLHVTAQATNSKRGMDYYRFFIEPDGGTRVELGTFDQTTMSTHAWPVSKDDVAQGLSIVVEDTNDSDDPRRANQLWLDQLVLVADSGSGTDPGGGDPGGGDPGGGDPGDPGGGGSGGAPATDRIIAGYYPSWAIYSAREYWVSYIPFDRVTHVYYAFANLDPDTHEVVIGDSFADLTNRKDPETDNGLPAGNLHQLTYFRDVGHGGVAYPHLKVIISVGGWSWSANFSAAAATPTSRYRFATSLRDFVDTYGLDGADIDWEFPTGDPELCGLEGNGCDPADPVNHALLLMACRLALGADKELSIAMPANALSAAAILPPLVSNIHLAGQTIMANCDPPCVVSENSPTAAEMLDYIHIMNYDQVGASWTDTTRHHAPLYGYEGPGGDPANDADDPGGLENLNAHYAVQAYLHARENYADFNADGPTSTPVIPAAKLTLGIPMYGRGFASVDPGGHDDYEGLFQYTDASERRRTPKGTWDGGKWGNSGVYAYWDLLLRHDGDDSVPGAPVYAVGPFDPDGNIDPDGRFYGTYLLEGDLFVGFDNLVSVSEKVDYAVEHGLGGVMFWDFPGDVSPAQIADGVAGATDAYPAKSLVHRIAERLEERAPAAE
jgi:GH18 family chitinase